MLHSASDSCRNDDENMIVSDSPSEDEILSQEIDTNLPKDKSGLEEASTNIVPSAEISPKLDDMFDSDSEDEFEYEDIDALSEATNVAATLHSNPFLMMEFYQTLFPFKYLFEWLNHSVVPSNDFQHREFAFTLQNDAYLRYQAFKTAEGLRKEVLRLNPSRFEIGPVYNENPKDRKLLRKSVFKPLEKELVFDIDLTDYDEIRTCCDKANICNKCWNFVTIAIKILDITLKEDFGFKHVLWVYSGRRGAHAWVCDRRARLMDDGKRKAVAAYLEVLKGGAQSGKKVNLLRPLHPHLKRSYEIAKESFQEQILEGQDPWQDTKSAEKLLQLLGDKKLTDALRKKWESQSNRPSKNKWADIDDSAGAGSLGMSAKQLLETKQDIILEYMYPRLDAEVSKHLNHLLKSPFVVHPGTGRVCVPIDSSRPEEFDPLSVPKVTDLLNEINAWDGGKGGKGSKVPDYEKTSLKPYINYFAKFVRNLLRDEANDRKVRNEGVMDF